MSRACFSFFKFFSVGVDKLVLHSISVIKTAELIKCGLNVKYLHACLTGERANILVAVI